MPIKLTWNPRLDTCRILLAEQREHQFGPISTAQSEAQKTSPSFRRRNIGIAPPGTRAGSDSNNGKWPPEDSLRLLLRLQNLTTVPPPSYSCPASFSASRNQSEASAREGEGRRIAADLDSFRSMGCAVSKLEGEDLRHGFYPIQRKFMEVKRPRRRRRGLSIVSTTELLHSADADGERGVENLTAVEEVEELPTVEPEEEKGRRLWQRVAEEEQLPGSPSFRFYFAGSTPADESDDGSVIFPKRYSQFKKFYLAPWYYWTFAYKKKWTFLINHIIKGGNENIKFIHQK